MVFPKSRLAVHAATLQAGSALPCSAPEFSVLLRAPALLLFLAEVAGMGWALLLPAWRGEEVTAGPCRML